MPGRLRDWLRGAASIGEGFASLTLDPSPRLRKLRQEAERTAEARRTGPLPPLPDSAYGPDAVPLEPPQGWQPMPGQEGGMAAASGQRWYHHPQTGREQADSRRPWMNP